MNYEEMSDTEINTAMTVSVFGCEGWELSEGGGQLFHCGADGSGYFAQEIVDYCNSWADMGPLIVETNVSIAPTREVNGGGLDGEWCAWKGDESQCDENPLRAAAIVYLMIKDGEK